MDGRKNMSEVLKDLSKEELIKLIIIGAKNWLAHDGLWFQAIEKKRGIEGIQHFAKL